MKKSATSRTATKSRNLTGNAPTRGEPHFITLTDLDGNVLDRVQVALHPADREITVTLAYLGGSYA